MKQKLQAAKQAIMQRRAWLKIAGVIVFVAVIGGIYATAQALYYQTPNKIWHDALSNSLQNKSVTTTIIQTTDDAERRQTITYNAGTQNQARSDVVIRSQGNLVVTETLGTKTADYSRYTQIQAEGKDFKNALNVWSKTEVSADAASTTQPPLLPGTALRTASVPGVPLVDAPIAQQINLYKLLNAAIATDFASVKSETIDGQAVRTYTATIKPAAYLTYVKALDDALDYKTLSAINPTTYEKNAPITVSLSVDTNDHRLMRLTIPGTTTYQESYSNYGKPFSITIPDKTVTPAELQNRLPND